MARTKSAGLNRLLNFIGLVDDEDPRDTYSDEIENDNSRNYVPPRRESRASRAETAPRRRNSYEQQHEPTRSTRDYRRADDQPRRSVGSYASSRSNSRTEYSSYRASRFDTSAAPSEPKPREEVRERRHPAQHRTTVYSVSRLEDCCDVIDSLLLHNTVLLNMEELDNATMQRCIDTLSGAVFALHATIKKVSERTYMAAPIDIQVDEIYSDRD